MAVNDLDEKLLALATEIQEGYAPADIARLIRLISPTPSTGQMNAESFEQVMAVLVGQNNRRPYSDKSITAARLVLVMGASIAEAAGETGLSRQVVNRLMLRLRSRMESLPAGWVKVSEWLPGEVAKQLRDISALLKSLHADKPLDELSYTLTLTKPVD